MDFVTPLLAIGSRVDAEDAGLLAARRIDTLVSFVPVPHPPAVERQLSVTLADREPLPAGLIDEVVAFVAARTAAGHRVLMHCEQGISRSPALAACFLHQCCGFALDQAFAAVRAARAFAAPHPALVASIRAHYAAAEGPADLSGNENPLGPSPRALAAIRGALPLLHRYPDREAGALREALADELALAPGNVVLGNGACELIDLTTRMCLADGGEVLIPDPAFPAYRSAAERAGARIVTVPLVQGAYSVEAFAERFSPATRLVVIASPHNPTGTLIPPADWARLRDALPDGAWLLLDEAYRDYAPQDALVDAPADVRNGARVIVLRSLSKVHGLAGLRIGYGLAPEPFARRLAALCPQYHVGTLAQIAALAALGDEPHRRASVAANADGRAALIAGLARMGADFVPSAANFVLVRAPHNAVARLDALGIRVKCMARYGLSGHIRVSVGRPDENARFLAALESLQREDQKHGRLAPA